MAGVRHRPEGQPPVRKATRRLLLAVLLLAVALPLGAALYAQRRDPYQWLWDDWAALVSSMLLGLLFFVLAYLLGRDGERRARSVADAVLMTTIGALQMSSARSFAGSDQQALRIAADARAALQHYPNAGPYEQSQLVETVEDAYSDLAFGTFSRADALPRSVWQQLEQGAIGVVTEARDLAHRLGRRSGRQAAEQLRRMADNVSFALSIGREVRGEHRPPVPSGSPRLLRCTWDGRLSTGDQDTANDVPEPTEEEKAAAEIAAQEKDRRDEPLPLRRERLSCLYRRELTVKKDWGVLFDPKARLACRVVLSDLSGTEGWYAPWYVSDVPPPLHPVNVLFDELHEPAGTDEVSDRPGLARFPEPIRHGGLPAGMRTRAITNLVNLLRQQRVATVCVLVYDVITDSGVTKRLVLDGNHRLAAARVLANERRGRWRRSPREGKPVEVRVLAFIMSELEQVDVPTSDPDGSFPDWRGFSPDIGLVRGTWLPERYRDLTGGRPRVS